ncbi:hypothetical protein LLG38_03635 [bacterium]|nr:hypothetical protein [bacterium]
MLVCTALILVSAVSITAFRHYAKQQVYAQTRSLAQRHALSISMRLNKSASATQTLSNTIETLVNNDFADRRVGLDIVKRFLQGNPDLICAWCIFEPNEFDGKDAEYVNTTYGNDIGRYGASYNKATGKIRIDITGEHGLLPGEGDWYVIPRNSARERLISPYTYAYYDNTPKFYETSYTVPIFRNGRVIGVVGVDIGLDFLSSTIKNIRPYGTGYAEIVAADGTLAASPNPSVRGKDLGNSPEDLRIKNAVIANCGIEITHYDKSIGDNVLTVLVPIKVGRADEHWGIAVTVPMSKAMASVTRLTYACTGISIIVLAFSLVVVKIIANQISFPIRQLSQAASRVAIGDMDGAREMLKIA